MYYFKFWMQIQACFDSIVDPTYTTEVITFLSRREAPSIAKKSRATLLMNKLKKNQLWYFYRHAKFLDPFR